MGGGKNTKQKKNKRSRKVLGVMEEVYSRKQYMGKEGRSEKCEGIGG